MVSFGAGAGIRPQETHKICKNVDDVAEEQDAEYVDIRTQEDHKHVGTHAK